MLFKPYKEELMVHLGNFNTLTQFYLGASGTRLHTVKKLVQYDNVMSITGNLLLRKLSTTRILFHKKVVELRSEIKNIGNFA